MFGTLLMLRSLTQTVYRQTFVWEPWESVSLAQCSGGSTTTSASTQQLYLFSHFYLTLMVSTTTATKNMKIVRLDDTHHSIIYYRNFLVKFINWKCPKCPNRTAYKSHVNNGRKKERTFNFDRHSHTRITHNAHHTSISIALICILIHSLKTTTAFPCRTIAQQAKKEKEYFMHQLRIEFHTHTHRMNPMNISLINLFVIYCTEIFQSLHFGSPK